MKTFLIVLGSIVLLIGLLWVWAFVPVKGILINLLPIRSVPEAYRDFPFAGQSADPRFSVTGLQGSMEHNQILRDAAGNYILETFERFYNGMREDKTHLYRVDTLGNIAGTFTLPDGMYLRSGYECDLLPDGEYNTYFCKPYLVSPEGYSAWLHNGEPTVIVPPTVGKKLSPDQFRPVYNEADAAFTFDSTAMLLAKGEWRIVRLGFEAWKYEYREEFKEKRERETAILPDSTLTVQEAFDFDHFPATQGAVELCYFQRTEYIGKAGLSGLGSPTGGGSEHWNGYGYFRLTLGNGAFCFKYPGEEYSGRRYFFRPDVYLSDHFAILKDEYSTYIIQYRNR